MDGAGIVKFIAGKEAVIFDMDGVLIDTSLTHELAYKSALSEISSLFNYKKYAGMRTDEAIKVFLSEDTTIKALAEKKSKKALALLDQLTLIIYSDKLLELLKNNGFKLALATSGSKERTNITLDKLNMRKYFDYIITGDDISKAKPHPEIYQNCVKNLGIDAKKCLVIEDSSKGLDSAKKAGIPVISLLSTENEKDLVNSDLILNDIYSLYSIFSYYFSLYKKKVFSSSKHEKSVVSIIPAGGIGSRLNYNKPKILYPLNGKSLLVWLHSKLDSFSKKIIVVTRPQFKDFIIDESKSKRVNVEVLTVDETQGTADTIFAAKNHVSLDDNFLIIWSDQVGLKKESISKAISSYYDSDADLLIPTILKSDPYIHLERDLDSKIISVRRKRTGDLLPTYGENDSGIFIIKGRLLFDSIKDMRSKYLENSNNSEFDFLSIIPYLSSKGFKVVTVPIITENETIGLNTLDEAKFHESNSLFL